MKPLTPKMIDVLQKLSVKSCVAHYMPYMGRFQPTTSYFLSTTMASCYAQINALLDRGLAERFDDDGFGGRHKVRITKAGREWLRQYHQGAK